MPSKQETTSAALSPSPVPALPALAPMLAEYTGIAHERADAAKHRAAILATAREMLGGADVHEVTMKEVARRVGIGQGTLYRKFPTKAHLAGAILSEDMLQIDAALQRRHRSGGSAADLLAWFADRMARFAAERADLIATSMTKENQGPGWYEHTAPVQWLLQTLAALFAAAEGAATPSAGLERARIVLPQLLFPGDVALPAARKAYRQRVQRLVALLAAGDA